MVSIFGFVGAGFFEFAESVNKLVRWSRRRSTLLMWNNAQTRNKANLLISCGDIKCIMVVSAVHSECPISECPISSVLDGGLRTSESER
jgi:hypothetical protein